MGLIVIGLEVVEEENGIVASFHWCANLDLEGLLLKRATGALF